MWNLNLYKLVFGVVLFCHLTNEIPGGVVAQQEVGSSGKSKNSQPKDHNSSHHKHHHSYNVQQIDLNITEPTVLVVHQLPPGPKTASSGLPTSETQTTSSSASDALGSVKSDDLFSALDASTGASSTSQTKTLSSETSGSVEPDSSENVSSEPKSLDSSISSPSSVTDTGSSISSETSSSSKPTKSVTIFDSLIFWLMNLYRKLLG